MIVMPDNVMPVVFGGGNQANAHATVVMYISKNEHITVFCPLRGHGGATVPL
jgi:hypothetical protein